MGEYDKMAAEYDFWLEFFSGRECNNYGSPLGCRSRCRF